MHGGGQQEPAERARGGQRWENSCRKASRPVGHLPALSTSGRASLLSLATWVFFPVRRSVAGRGTAKLAEGRGPAEQGPGRELALRAGPPDRRAAGGELGLAISTLVAGRRGHGVASPRASGAAAPGLPPLSRAGGVPWGLRSRASRTQPLPGGQQRPCDRLRDLKDDPPRAPRLPVGGEVGVHDLLQEPPPQALGSHCPTTGGPRASEHGDGSCHTAWEMPRAFILWLVPAQPPGQGAVVGRDRTQTQRGRVLAPRSPRGGFAVRFQGWSGLGW